MFEYYCMAFQACLNASSTVPRDVAKLQGVGRGQGLLIMHTSQHSTPPTNAPTPTHLDNQQSLTPSYALQCHNAAACGSLVHCPIFPIKIFPIKFNHSRFAVQKLAAQFLPFYFYC